MPSKAPLSPLIMGTRSNAVASPLRTSSTASSAVKPLSVAVKSWSAPRGTVPVPGVSAMRYGAAASRLDVHANMADRPWRK